MAAIIEQDLENVGIQKVWSIIIAVHIELTYDPQKYNILNFVSYSSCNSTCVSDTPVLHM